MEVLGNTDKTAVLSEGKTLYCILSSGPKRGKLNRRKTAPRGRGYRRETAPGGRGYGRRVDRALCLGQCAADFRQKPLQKCRV